MTAHPIYSLAREIFARAVTARSETFNVGGDQHHSMWLDSLDPEKVDPDHPLTGVEVRELADSSIRAALLFEAAWKKHATDNPNPRPPETT